MKVILDTNFIVSCIRKKIEFVTQLKEQGYTVCVPREIIQELKDIKKKKTTTHEDKIAIDVALALFESKNIKKITIGKGIVDDSLIKKGNKGEFIATLDKGIQKRIPRVITIFSSKRSVGVK